MILLNLWEDLGECQTSPLLILAPKLFFLQPIRFYVSIPFFGMTIISRQNSVINHARNLLCEKQYLVTEVPII